MGMDRRGFLKFTSANAAMTMLISLPAAALNKSAGAVSTTPRSKYDTWDIYLRIFPDNRIEIASPVQEMGQHMKTAGAMLIAEELDADWNLVTCVASGTHLHIDPKSNRLDYRHSNMNTGGSHALRDNWEYLRQAGATAKAMLRQAAAIDWGCDISDVITGNSLLIRQSNGATKTFGDVAKKAAKLAPPKETLPLKSPQQFSIIGKPKTTVDIDDIVTGKPLYSIDTDYPGQLHAVIERCPFFQGSIQSYDKDAALAVSGVVDIIDIEPTAAGGQKHISAGIAVVAKTLWIAMKARRLLKPVWNNGPWKNESHDSLSRQYQMACQGTEPGKVLREDGNIEQGLKSCSLVLDRIYQVPFLHHACLEPMNCIADVREDHAVMDLGHQSPRMVAATIAELAGIDPLKVEVRNRRMGGGLGRKWTSDFVIEAAILSMKLKSPVKVTWTREDEMEQDFFGPMQITRIRAGITNEHSLNSWHYRAACKRGGAITNNFPAGLVENLKVETLNPDTGTPAGAWRGPGHFPMSFANESMLDELAHEAGVDPLLFRKKIFKGKGRFDFNAYGAQFIDADRMWVCYEHAAKLAKWQSPRAKGRGLGIAGHFTFGSYAAFVVEVEVNTNKRSQGKAPYRVIKCWGAIDCGLAVNPNHIKNQMEGGFIDGLNAAMFNQAKIENGRVLTSNFDRLPIVKMAQAPNEIESVIVQNAHPPTGVGEPPTAPAAAALTNAIFAACGQRIRTLPIELEV